jgi:hypothetical protein
MSNRFKFIKASAAAVSTEQISESAVSVNDFTPKLFPLLPRLNQIGYGTLHSRLLSPKQWMLFQFLSGTCN